MTDDCACLYSGNDDLNDFEHSEIRKARKPHKCVECHETIQPGTKYERFVARGDGRFFTVTICLLCREIQHALYCDGWYFGHLWGDIADQIFAEQRFTSGCLDKLETVEAKQYLSQRWMDWVNEQTGKARDAI